MVFMVAMSVLAMVMTSAPSLAQNNPTEDPLVFGPDPANPGQGDTFTCTGNPPFTVPSPPGNCGFVGFGPPPSGLVCDIPTTVFFSNAPGSSEAAFICHLPVNPPANTPVKKHHHHNHQHHHKHHGVSLGSSISAG
jgi:hypothetical protein